jgi:hypothetical protein
MKRTQLLFVSRYVTAPLTSLPQRIKRTSKLSFSLIEDSAVSFIGDPIKAQATPKPR